MTEPSISVGSLPLGVAGFALLREGVSVRLEVAVADGLSREEILALPAMVDVVTACRALGLGRTLGYQLVRRGEFPCRVLRVGRRYLIPTADLRTVLGLAAADDEH